MIEEINRIHISFFAAIAHLNVGAKVMNPSALRMFLLPCWHFGWSMDVLGNQITDLMSAEDDVVSPHQKEVESMMTLSVRLPNNKNVTHACKIKLPISSSLWNSYIYIRKPIILFHKNRFSLPF